MHPSVLGLNMLGNCFLSCATAPSIVTLVLECTASSSGKSISCTLWLRLISIKSATASFRDCTFHTSSSTFSGGIGTVGFVI